MLPYLGEMADAETDRQADELRNAIAKIAYDNLGDPEIDLGWDYDIADAIIKELPQLLRQAGWTPPAIPRSST